ncbi:MAG: TIGR03619 family F420-dependent LLM class oxidoreductase [Thermomicrobiales bacterium]
MRVGLRLPSYAWPDATYDGVRRLGAYARQAEARGFDSLWVIEHLLVSPALYGVAWHDPLLVLAHVAAVTERARLGTAILVLPLRHPAIVAREVISLDFLSGGRFILGVGTGWEEREFATVGVPLKERGARLDEGLTVIRRLLSEPSVTHHGRFFHLDEIAMEPRPPRVPPVWIAGGSLGHAPETPDKPYIAPAVLDRILHAAGWMSRSSGSDAAMVEADWLVVQEHLRANGRDPATLTFAHTQFVHLSEAATRDAVIAEQVPHFLRVMGDHRGLPELTASYLLGTIDDIQRRIAALAAIGLQELIITPVSDDPRQIDLLAKHIVAPFQG